MLVAYKWYLLKSYWARTQTIWLYQKRYGIFSFGSRFGSNSSLFLIDESYNRYGYRPTIYPMPVEIGARSRWRILSTNKVCISKLLSFVAPHWRDHTLTGVRSRPLRDNTPRMDVYPPLCHDAYCFDLLWSHWIHARISCRFIHSRVSSPK